MVYVVRSSNDEVKIDNGTNKFCSIQLYILKSRINQNIKAYTKKTHVSLTNNYKGNLPWSLR